MARIDQNPRLNYGRLLRSIQPTSGELKSAISNVSSTKKRLEKSFNLKKFQRIGSHARSSAINSFSDLDFLAVLARNEAKWGGSVVKSDTVIKKISQDLNSRFTTTTVRKDMQAVVVQFGGGQKSMDVVPGFFHSFKNRRPVYFIPDGYGGWMETSPEAHNTFINNENIRSGEKQKKVGQLIRFWKHSRASSIPISSFYIDLLLADSGICIGAKSYPMVMYEFFKLMYDRKCRGLNDPVGIAGVVGAVKTQSQINTLYSHIENSLDHAIKAVNAEHNKQFKEANRQWDIIFNHNFL
ncbi:hypothetical protein O0V09_18265 [Dasania sp. GY-19]|uniref:Nucleotidyltransferase n=1 Tax=Dasania phycosphaerae TaxID=2950436 RepID=A0A9J6RS01_9GAMM|nr:hypothetical protein [Dasania phycosphaerae]MCZ0867146.1 hypothetical protein [Dasania phycosphaerae]